MALVAFLDPAFLRRATDPGPLPPWRKPCQTRTTPRDRSPTRPVEGLLLVRRVGAPGRQARAAAGERPVVPRAQAEPGAEAPAPEGARRVPGRLLEATGRRWPGGGRRAHARRAAPAGPRPPVSAGRGTGRSAAPAATTRGTRRRAGPVPGAAAARGISRAGRAVEAGPSARARPAVVLAGRRGRTGPSVPPAVGVRTVAPAVGVRTRAPGDQEPASVARPRPDRGRQAPGAGRTAPGAQGRAALAQRGDRRRTGVRQAAVRPAGGATSTRDVAPSWRRGRTTRVVRSVAS